MIAMNKIEYLLRVYIEKVSKMPLSKTSKDATLNKLQTYLNLWKNIQNSIEVNGNFPDKGLYCSSSIVLPERIGTINIGWYIGDVLKNYQKYAKNSIELYSLDDLNALIGQDVIMAQDEVKKKWKIVKSKYSHDFDYLLVVYFEPFKSYLLADGWHKYIEYMKGYCTGKIPVVIVNSSEITQYLFLKRHFVLYKILELIGEILQLKEANFRE